MELHAFFGVNRVSGGFCSGVKVFGGFCFG